MVKISIIIPVYNVEDYLEECLNSILNQTFEDFEVICVNNGSTDNSLNIINKFSKKDNRMKVININEKGAGIARNTGLKNAKGDFIYFIDSDDYIIETTLSKLYDNIQSNNSDFVICKIARFNDDHGVVDYSKPGFDFEKIFSNVDFNNFVFDYHDVKQYILNASFAPWTKFYRKEFLDNYDDFLFNKDIAFQDVLFHVKSMIRAEKISFMPDFLYMYRNNPNSITSNTSNKIHIFKIIDDIEKFLKEENHFEEFYDNFILFKINQILGYIVHSKSEEYFQKAKKEFEKIEKNDLPKISSDKKIIPRNTKNNFNLVLKSNSIIDYIDLTFTFKDNKIRNLINEHNKK